MKKYLFLISCIFLSCQEEITPNLPGPIERIVVEGAIEQGFPPYVILTKNQGYFESIDSDTYSDLFINDASVLVWTYKEDGTKDSVILKQLPPPFDTIPIYTDTNTIYNSGSEFLGEVGQTYFLEVKWNDKVIRSSTTIPKPSPLDCLWVEQSETAEKEFKCDINAVYSDDGNIQNNILIKSKRLEHWKKDTTNTTAINKSDSRLILIDAGTDVLINGESFETYFPKPREEGGFPSGAYNAEHYKILNNNDSIFLPHDVVLIKFSQIDNASLKFWRGVVRQSTSNNNPFTEPMNLVSNIENGLGVWTGYGSVYYRIPIIKDTIIKQEYQPDLVDIF